MIRTGPAASGRFRRGRVETQSSPRRLLGDANRATRLERRLLARRDVRLAPLHALDDERELLLSTLLADVTLLQGADLFVGDYLSTITRLVLFAHVGRTGRGPLGVVAAREPD